jgi:hypothetical protein
VAVQAAGESILTRRRFLGRAALAGGALALAPALAPTARAARPRRGPGPAEQFFTAEDVNFMALFAIGGSCYGAGEFGEIARVVNRINARGATYDAIYDEWTAMARTLGSYGDDALARGRKVTARSAFLRAAQYMNQALFFVLGTKKPEREEATYRAMNDWWSRAAGLFTPAFEPVAIPYEGTTMPGWLLKPDASAAPRPTVILNNGSDGQIIDLYAFGGAAALERGYNALIYEGPGQGSMLFERKIPFRPDWEKVVTPVVDFLRARPDVDPERIAITGWSMCGELVPRAAAFEHRLAAVVADPGVTSVIAAWGLPQVLLRLVRQGKRDELNGAWAEFMSDANATDRFEIAKRSEIFRAPDAYTLIRDLMEYTNADVAHLITSPTLVVDYDLEAFYPGQARKLYDLLTSPKTFVRLTAALGAQYHDAPMAPLHRNEVVFDWLDQTLGL